MDGVNLSKIKSEIIPETHLIAGKNLLKRLMFKISLQEFLKECTYLMLDCGFSELRPLPLPFKPAVLYKFEALEPEEQKKTKGKVCEDKRVSNYFEEAYAIRMKNKSTALWLKENLERLREYGDTNNAMRVSSRLKEFEGVK